jgi:hypothetical protein
MNKKQQKDSKKNSKQNIIEGIEFIERLDRDLGATLDAMKILHI